MGIYCSLAIVDNTDPDNLACVLALANAKSKHRLLGVIVTGRAANLNRDAALGDVNSEDSSYIRLLNTVRMKNFLKTAGHSDVPVFMGGIAPHTLVPHRVHIHEKEFGDCSQDQYEKLRVSRVDLPSYGIDGNLDTAAGYLLGAGGLFDIVLGGPMTDVADLIYHYPKVAVRIRSIHAQFGMFGFGEKGLMEFGDRPRGKRQFNVACDPGAASAVLQMLPTPVYLYPSDITRVDAIGFETPEHLQAHLERPVSFEVGSTPAKRELVRLYRIAYEKMVKPRGEKIYIHDLAPAFGYLDTFPFAEDEIEDRSSCVEASLYELMSVEIINVPSEENEQARWGEIDIETHIRGGDPLHGPRYLATKVNPEKYLKLMRQFLV